MSQDCRVQATAGSASTTRWECQRCTVCCCWPGEVRLTDGEIAQLAKFKGMAEWEFIQQYTRVNFQRHGLALQEKPNGECIFLEDKDCVVQPVKPGQCREFPNTWNFPDFQKSCRAVRKAQAR